jgi:hypothetical protein
MNSELIKKLADEARIKPMNGSWAYRLSDEFEEKFAELIVLECVREFVHKQPVSVNVSNRARHVFKHFGVKE